MVEGGPPVQRVAARRPWSRTPGPDAADDGPAHVEPGLHAKHVQLVGVVEPTHEPEVDGEITMRFEVSMADLEDVREDV